ncbi:MAG: hypothetical protein IPP53_17400 [Bacteroidetes bacterium]|nr:hypothetical protein [Bacteroidota bacterium]
MNITTTAASGVDASNRGCSNYGVLVLGNSTGYEITRCNITSGQHQTASDGTANGANNGGAGLWYNWLGAGGSQAGPLLRNPGAGGAGGDGSGGGTTAAGAGGTGGNTAGGGGTGVGPGTGCNWYGCNANSRNGNNGSTGGAGGGGAG